MEHAGVHSWGFQISVTSLLSLQTDFRSRVWSNLIKVWTALIYGADGYIKT